MVSDTRNNRWAPIYNEEQLIDTIKQIRNSEDFYAKFYETSFNDKEPCQGDILQFSGSIPLIDKDGEPKIIKNCDHWMIFGNTCDFDKENNNYSQLIPIFDISNIHTLTAENLVTLRKYQYTNRFYIPAWPIINSGLDYLAEFTLPVLVEKELLFNDKVKILARLSYVGWILLHSCIVRFLARDDGRFD